jgi:hypothetical protein
MTRQNLQFGRLLRIPIGLDYSWFLIFALFTWLLAQIYYPVKFRNWPSLLCWLIGAVTSIELFAGVLWIALGDSPDCGTGFKIKSGIWYALAHRAPKWHSAQWH